MSNLILLVVVVCIIVILVCVLAYYKQYKTYDITLTPINSLKQKKYFGSENLTVDDVSLMNSAVVDKIIIVESITDVLEGIRLARLKGKKISMKGTKHSMGGHTIAKGGYQFDMLRFNRVVKFSEQDMEIVVEPGIIWSDLILYLDEYGLSPMILQSYSSFSVGGTIAVNAHGITSDHSISESIVEILAVVASGEIVSCSRKENVELFGLLIGGYGLFAVIVSVRLKVVKNCALDFEFKRLNRVNFHRKYQKCLARTDVEIKFARIDISNFHDITISIFSRVPIQNQNGHRDEIVISKPGSVRKKDSAFEKLAYKWIVPTPGFQKIRFKTESRTGKPLDLKKPQQGPDNERSSYERNSILYESADQISTLYSPIFQMNATHILQEFFVPAKSDPISGLSKGFNMMMETLKHIFVDNKRSLRYVSLLNITIRYVRADTTTYLKYAREDMYAFVLYYRLPNKKDADRELHCIHAEVVKRISNHEINGSFYLPYRHHYSKEQLQTAYPNVTSFFFLKRKYDPEELFSNKWYINYGSQQ